MHKRAGNVSNEERATDNAQEVKQGKIRLASVDAAPGMGAGLGPAPGTQLSTPVSRCWWGSAGDLPRATLLGNVTDQDKSPACAPCSGSSATRKHGQPPGTARLVYVRGNLRAGPKQTVTPLTGERDHGSSLTLLKGVTAPPHSPLLRALLLRNVSAVGEIPSRA